MSWLQLWLECGPEQVELAVGLLEDLGAASVSVSLVNGAPVFGDARETQPYWQRSRISALLSPDVDVDILFACLRNRIGTAQILAYGVSALPDADWVQAGQRGYEARVFGGKLCICPSWAEPAPVPHVLILDPGLAFGTGAHATTALCLDWLANQDLRGCAVIDYGCGSGVLGLAAALLGARMVYALDTDPQALVAARENARRNGFRQSFRVLQPGQEPVPAADFLVANILLGSLQELAREFSTLVRRGGRIALSGVLAVQAQDCTQAYRDWFAMGVPEYRAEWALLPGQRTG